MSNIRPLVEMRIQTLTAAEMRNVLACLSRQRAHLPSYAHWQPRVELGGPEHYTIETDPLPVEVAEAVLTALRGLIEVGHE